ncbi:MAG: hypothetical protein M1416_00630 [Candidatus Pacearchaeota archaeon]|nr:hypothetical protein [Candidatus Pacearchaeota archaeon]
MKKRGKFIQINISNRFIYTFIVLGIFAIIGVGVYAYGTSSPSNFGHSAGEMNFAGGFNVTAGNINVSTGKIFVGNTTINGTTIKSKSLCLGTSCRTNINKAIYSITNNYCEGKGSLSASEACLTKACSGTSHCPGGYTFYPYYQCDGDCGYCVTGSGSGINTCANSLEGYILT